MSITNLNGVRYTPQTLTSEQQAQARQNIGAAEEGGGGTQVQANWNETDTDSPAYIQNKPTIPAAQVQSDWNQSDDSAVDYIKNKPSIPVDSIKELNGLGITWCSKNGPQISRPSGTVYKNGILYTETGNMSFNNSENTLPNIASTGGIVPIGNDANANYTMIVWSRFDSYNYSNERRTYNGHIFIEMHARDAGDPYSMNYNDYHCTNLTVLYNKFFWPQFKVYASSSTWYGRKIFLPGPMIGNGDGTSTIIPDVTNMTGIYVPKGYKTLYENAITTYYPANTDLSALFAKIIEYDVLTPYLYDNPGFGPEPIVLPS